MEFLRGDLDVAARAASDQEVQLLAGNPAWSFKFLLLEAEILQFQGKSQDVVNVLDRDTPAFSPTDDLEIKRLTLLTLAHARLGQSEQSAEELQTAQQLSTATNSHLQGELLRTEGILERRNGRPADAESSFRASLAFARRNQDEYLAATDLLNLGIMALQAEHIDEALDRFNASSQLAAKIHAELLLQSSLGNTGWAYYNLGDFERALEGFQQAEVQARKLGATDSEVVWLESAGRAYSQLGNLQQAEGCYEQARQVAQGGYDLARQAENEAALGMLSLRRNQPVEARAHADAALRDARQLRDQPAETDALLVEALTAATAHTPEAEGLLTQLLHENIALPSVRWTAADALAKLYAAEGRPTHAEQWYRRSIQTFETQRNSVQEDELRLPFSTNGDELYRHYAEFLIASNRPSEALRLLDSARGVSLNGTEEDPGRKHRSAARTPRMGTSLNTFRGFEVVLFYSLGQQRSYLWAIDRRGAHLHVLAPEGEIAARIQTYQANILRSRDPLQESNPDAQWLYENLVGSVEALIPKNARVLVVPDGSMHGFNLETLLRPGPQGFHYWIDDVRLTMAPSLRLVSQASSRDAQAGSASAGKLLLMGDPMRATKEYDTLPHASAEIENVEQYFPLDRRTTLTRAAAVPEAYAASRPVQYKYLHFVAHGMASNLRPLNSAIILSPSAVDPDRYKLYARDIIQQPLNARLVTISACYGSGVRNYAGEGMVGLSWAFLRAGAHQVIAGLWEVNDSSTPQMMDQMYHSLTEGADPDQALRTAKLSMLHSQGVFRKPIYWAAFQLYTGS